MNMINHVIRASFQFIVTFLMSVPMILIGIPIVAFGLLFRRSTSMSKPFSQYAKEELWYRVQLPDWQWIKPWDHVVDGFKGDTRGWWHTNCIVSGGSDKFINMWWWGAIRNTADYWRRFMISCPVDECEVIKLDGNADEVNANGKRKGWNFLVAIHKTTGRRWYQFCAVIPWSENRCVNVWLGWKFKLSHAGEDFIGNEYKRWKGFEFLINPFKAYKD